MSAPDFRARFSAHSTFLVAHRVSSAGSIQYRSQFVASLPIRSSTCPRATVRDLPGWLARSAPDSRESDSAHSSKCKKPAREEEGLGLRLMPPAQQLRKLRKRFGAF